jgi:hypothetical protein
LRRTLKIPASETSPNFRLSIPQASAVVILWMGLLMLPLAPVNNRYSGAAVLLFLAVALGSRNIAAIGAAALAMNLSARFLFQVSSWHDQHWVQWSSISSLITGHNIFATSPLYQFSLASYMPAGDLFGGLFIALGVQQYWLVWHVLVVCLLALPLLLAPSFTSLLIFIGTSSFYPFCDYTTAGGTLEIGYATTIAAIALYRAGRLLTASIVFFAFAALFRQPAVMLVPFVLLILWRNRDWRRIRIFAALLVLFGGIYILADPPGAFHYLFQVWEGYHQELYNYTPGLAANYTVSTIPHAFGVPDSVPWYAWRAIYIPLTLAGVAALLAVAWFRKNQEEVLLLGVFATVAVYVLSRGYAQYSYVFAAFLPLLAFLYPAASVQPVFARPFAKGLAFVFLWIGIAPAALWASGLLAQAIDSVHPARAFYAAASYDIPPSGPVVPIAPIVGSDATRHTFPLSHAAQFQLIQPAYLSGIRLSGDHIEIQEIKGVMMRYPTDTEMRGVVTEGWIEGSEDGRNFTPLSHFHNAVNYSIWPATIALPATPRPLLALRLRPLNLYLGHQEWILGNVEFLERK